MQRLFLFFLVIVLFSCTKENLPSDNKVVVEAFLFAGQKVENIKLSTLLAYGGTDTVARPINDAQIDIVWKNNNYRLVSSNDSGEYHYPGNELQIIENEVYEFRLNYNGTNISALTICPPKPASVALTKDTMQIVFVSLLDSFLTGGNITPPDPDSVVVSWPNPNNLYYYVVAQNIENPKENIFPDFIDDLRNFFFQTQPTTQNRYVFSDTDFRHYGRHQIRVYRVNQEYVDLFTSFDQDSRTQAEPFTNVINGLGIFTAVSYQSEILFVKK